MRTHIALGVALGCAILGAQTTPQPKPDKAQAKAVQLNETEALKVENIQLRLQLAKATEKELQASLTELFTAKCVGIGGSSVNDCIIDSRSPGIYTVTPKPAPAKPEAAK